jgi:glutamate decarboxylase
VVNVLANDIIKACDYLKVHGGNATPPQLHDAYKTALVKC